MSRLMWLAHLENIPQAILTEYGPALAGLHWFPVSGGFSGAEVWRGEDAQGVPRVALKRWPVGTTKSRLSQIHAWMGEAAHLSFVPRVLLTPFGSDQGIETSIGGRPPSTTHSLRHERAEGECINFVWDATSWLPGIPPTPASKAEVENACESVAEMHIVWSKDQVIGPSPGILRRIEILSQWLANAMNTIPQQKQSLTNLAERAWGAVHRIAPFALKALIPWQNVPLQLQPCLRDLHGEHVLFRDGRATGIVDYGAMDVDTPALDIARLLGDLACENTDVFALGVKKYRDFRPNSQVEDELVAVLDQAGITCSIIGWLARISTGHIQTSTKKIEARLLHLLGRAEKFNPI